MTHEEFDAVKLTIKIPFRVSEAARQILVLGMDKDLAIYSCNIQTAAHMAMLDKVLSEIESQI